MLPEILLALIIFGTAIFLCCVIDDCEWIPTIMMAILANVAFFVSSSGMHLPRFSFTEKEAVKLLSAECGQNYKFKNAPLTLESISCGNGEIEVKRELWFVTIKIERKLVYGGYIFSSEVYDVFKKYIEEAELKGAVDEKFESIKKRYLTRLPATEKDN